MKIIRIDAVIKFLELKINQKNMKNRFLFFFYDYAYPSGKRQLLTELNTACNFSDDASFTNNIIMLAPSLFMSYFLSDKFTILGFV